jgi:acyl carrier protein
MNENVTSHDGLGETIRTFIIQSFAPGERPENLPSDLDLIRSGVLDSLAIVHTASFLQELAGTEIEAHELTPKNIGSIAAMASFVRRRRAEL